MQDPITDPISFLAKTDADTLYFHQAMRQDDKPLFVEAVVKEINDHIDRKHWELIPKSEVPANVEVLPAVWSMKRKRDLVTWKPSKHKARLNIHGGKQELGVNYFDTYSPVVGWLTVCFLFLLVLLLNWSTHQIDFILAFP